MYRIPLNLDINDIVGSNLDQIRAGCCDVQFVFSSKTIIAVQSRVTILSENQIIASWEADSGWSTLIFQRLLNATVGGYRVANDRTLAIHLSGDLTLHMHDDSDQFESMQIYRKGDFNGPIVI